MSLDKHLTQKTYFGGLWALMRNYFLIFLIAYVSITVDNLFFYLGSIWFIGILQFAVGESLLHEASHGHLSRNRRFNNFLGIFCTYPFFNVMDSYKKSHFNHHKHLGDPRHDESAEIYYTYGLYKPNANMRWLWFYKPILGASIYYFITGTLLVKLKKHPLELTIFWLGLMLILFYVGCIKIFILYWLVPLFWCFPTYLYWAEITDHYNAKSGTRSNINPLYNIICHNGGYHAVHHRHPTIPWFHLKEAHRQLGNEDPTLNEDLTMGVFDTFKQIRNKHENLSSKITKDLR